MTDKKEKEPEKTLDTPEHPPSEVPHPIPLTPAGHTPVVPKVVLHDTKEVKPVTKEELLKKISECLATHGGRESDIPFGHPYWGWANEYRSMLRQ